MRRVAVIGVGMSLFGKQPERSLVDLGVEASRAAIKDAGVKPKDIQVCYCANYAHVTWCLAQEIGGQVGVNNIEMVNVENACAGGSTALRGVWYAIATGLYDIGLVIGVEQITTSPLAGRLITSETDLEGCLGLSMPARAALRMKRHMAEYGSTAEQFAQISVKNHLHGCLNPYAQYQKKFTLEEVLNSRMIAEPLTLYECSPNSDGSAAAILCAQDKVSRYTSKPVWITASVLKSPTYLALQKDICRSYLTEQCAEEAYKQAGVEPKDLDFVELHDAFASTELYLYEELGLCPIGEGGRLVDEGATALGGRIPVNPSGGLLAQGHPISASGVRQICEITWHLRDQAGRRQVPGAKVAMAHMEGGIVAGLGSAACSIHILSR
jgi:benzoylsuccinyl-CoA thiolase BbsB subunit